MSGVFLTWYVHTHVCTTLCLTYFQQLPCTSLIAAIAETSPILTDGYRKKVSWDVCVLAGSMTVTVRASGGLRLLLLRMWWEAVTPGTG